MPWIEPTPNWHRVAACQGKVSFDTAARAMASIKRSIRSDRRQCEKGARLAAYKCRHCHAWHVGNTWREGT